MNFEPLDPLDGVCDVRDGRVQAGADEASGVSEKLRDPWDLRSGLNKLFIFSKLRKARSRLYRRQLLQVNIRWKSLDEIYKMYILLHRSDIKTQQKKSS